jgi:DNA-binding transcriptional MocR family regulator
MVAPTYYLAANIFRGVSSLNMANVDCGYAKRITGIPEDEQGLNVSVLESQLEKFEQEPEMEKPLWQRCTYRYVFYGVPTFSNPTGSIMSLSRRNRLIEVCLSISTLIVARKEIRHAADNGRCL